jgi:hypothetical protein
MTSPGGRDPYSVVLVAEPARAPPQPIPFYPVQVALLTALYFGAARLGLTMAVVAEQVTAVWPPTGIALAALLLLGYRAWPGIALGAFLANATTSRTPPTANRCCVRCQVVSLSARSLCHFRQTASWFS